MHKIDFYNRICIMKILPVRKRLSKPLALGRPQPPFKVAVSQRFTATCASRQGNYRFRLANVFDSLFLPSRIFIIKQFFCKINFMFNFQKTRISGYIIIYYIFRKEMSFLRWNFSYATGKWYGAPLVPPQRGGMSRKAKCGTPRFLP